MKKTFLILICAMVAAASMAQPAYTEKEQSLLDSCQRYGTLQEYRKAADYASQLLTLRTEKGDKRAIAKTLVLLCNITMNGRDTVQAVFYFRAALQAMTELNDPSAIELAINLGVFHYHATRYDSSLYYCRKAVQLARKHNQRYQEARAYLFIGRCDMDSGRLTAALDTFRLTLSIFQELHKTGDVTVALNNIGLAHIKMAHPDSAVMYILRSLDLAKKANLQDVIAVDLNDLLVALQLSPALDSTLLREVNAARRSLSELPGPSVQVSILGNLGAGFFREQRYDSALYYLDQAYSQGQGNMLASQEATLLLTLGLTHAYRLEYRKALEALFRSRTLLASQTDRLLKAKAASGLGRTYLNMASDSIRKDWPDSLRPLDRATMAQRAAVWVRRSMALDTPLSNIDLELQNERMIAEVHALTGRVDLAKEEFNRYMARLESEQAMKAKTNEAVAMRRYHFDMREAEKDKQMALAEARHTSTIWTTLISAGFIIILLILYFVWRRRYERTMYNMQIVRSRQKILLNKVEEHFIDNGIMSVDTFIRRNDPKTASDYLVRFSHLFTASLRNASETEVSLEEDLDQLRTYIGLQQEQYTEGPLTYNIEVDGDIDKEVTAIPPMIFQVLVENAVKYAFYKAQGGHIEITVKRVGNMIEGTVRDNGMGRTAARLIREKQDARHGRARASMGTELAKEIVRLAEDRRHKTNFEIVDLFDEKGQAAGTLARFTLPYKYVTTTMHVENIDYRGQ